MSASLPALVRRRACCGTCGGSWGWNMRVVRSCARARAALSRARARHAERVPEARGKPTSTPHGTPEYSHRYLYDEADEPVSGRMQTNSIDPFDAMVCEYEESRNSSASMNVRSARPVEQPSESAPFACARFAQQGRRLARALAEGRLASTPVWLCSALLYAFIRPSVPTASLRPAALGRTATRAR